MSDREEAECANEIYAEGVLNFVDLAGSERVSNISEMSNPLETVIAMNDHKKCPVISLRKEKTTKVEQLSNEGRHINTSLFYLC